MRRMTCAVVTALLVIAGAGLASAQIAAPRLNTVATESDTPINPAVTPWAHNSSVGAAYSDLTVEIEVPPAPAVEGATGSGQMVQGRWVGETFAVGAELFTLDADFDIAGLGTGVLENEWSWVGVAGQFGGVASVGVGQQTSEEGVDHDVGNDERTTATLPMGGVSVRLAEVFYIGAAAGDETVERFDQSVTPSTFEADRGVVRYGVAYAMRDGESGVHLEYYVQERDEINDTATGFSQDSEESDGITAELVFANVLLAVEQFDTDVIAIGTGILASTLEQSRVSLGWVPLEGLSVVASAGSTEDTAFDPDGTVNRTISSDAVTLAVGWGF